MKRRKFDVDPGIEAQLRVVVEGMAKLERQATPMKPKEYVYVTKADFGFKIGRTTRPHKRPLQVAGNCPIKLEVVALIEVDDMREAEARLHSHFAAKHLRGEWFALTDEDVEFVRNYPKSYEALIENDDGGDVPF